MNRYPKISICIPTHNNEYTLLRTIKSIQNQKYPNVEVIIVENNSIDNTFEVCKEIENIYENVKLFQSNIPGVSNARNICLNNVTGEIIGFCDGDDTYESDILFKLLEQCYR